ncbi:MAG: acyl-CoA synthetase [Acidimicrobiales bacterium]
MSDADAGAVRPSEESVGGVLRGDVFVSSQELIARARRGATGLRSLGVVAGDSIAILLRNDHEFFEACFAAAALGAAPVPINWHGSAQEVAYVVADSKARVLVGHADLLRHVGHALPPSVTVLGVTTPTRIAEAFAIDEAFRTLPPDIEEWSTWRDEFEPLESTFIGDATSMIYTSGTTGNPKGVRRIPGTNDSSRTGEYMVEVTQLFGAWRGMRTIMAGPMYHSAPYAYGLVAARAYNGFLVLEDRFDPEEFLSLIEKHRITSLYMVPTMFVRLLRLPREVRSRYDISSLRHVSHTAAPCPPDVKRALIEWWGPIVSEFYGSTEVGFIAGCTSEEWLAHPGTVGRALASCEVEIIGDDGPVPIGESGEVFVRALGNSDFTYHGKDDARAEVERNGLITCGDIGFLDTDGFLYLCDRARDMIISGGVNIYPIEIEACLLKLGGVGDCAVFGIPDDEYGESVAAAIKLDSGASLSVDAIQAHVRNHLAGFKVPKLVTFHDELPREDSGKMFKRKLRQPYWENSGRSI